MAWLPSKTITPSKSSIRPFEQLLELVASLRPERRVGIGDEEDALAHPDRDTQFPLPERLDVDRQPAERRPSRGGHPKQCLVLRNPDVASLARTQRSRITEGDLSAPWPRCRRQGSSPSGRPALGTGLESEQPLSRVRNWPGDRERARLPPDQCVSACAAESTPKIRSAGSCGTASGTGAVIDPMANGSNQG